VDHTRNELLIASIARELCDCAHVAVGAASPIPAAAALLAQRLNGALRVSLLGSEHDSPFTDGGRELFDCAAQGRIDAFFLSGVQIDQDANVNLLGLGSYPRLSKRFSGNFGSAYLYHLVPKVILFSWSHNPSVLVEAVDFVSASGPLRRAQAGAASMGIASPWALITNRCWFRFDHESLRFRLHRLHPGETLKSVQSATGFHVDHPGSISFTDPPTDEELAWVRGNVAERMRACYPRFARNEWKD